MKYIVKVTERNYLQYEVEADSEIEAEELVRSGEIDKPEPEFSSYDISHITIKGE